MGGDGITRAEHLLFLILDQLRLANWQRTKDGARGRNKPKPLSPISAAKRSHYGHTDRAPDEVKKMLGQYGPNGTGSDGGEP